MVRLPSPGVRAARRRLRAAALALPFAIFGSAVAMAQMVGGEYRVHGTNPDGSAYQGTARIMPTSNSTCRITWETGTSSAGICMMDGKSLAASYVLDRRVGLVLYQLQPDGSLKGVWTMADQPGAGTETLTPAK